MPGVVRPYTLQDVLGTLNQNSSASQVSTVINGLGFFAEVDETTTSQDAVVTLVTTPLGWDQENWGAIGWQ